MTVALLKKAEEWTQDEFLAWLADPTSPLGAQDATLAELARLRTWVEQGETNFTAQDVTIALNQVEAHRLLVQQLFTIYDRNLAKVREGLGGTCLYCDWRHKPELEFPVERELTGEEIRSADQRYGDALREHVKVCPNHPMRAIEAELAAAHVAIRGWAEECDKHAKEMGWDGPYTTETDKLFQYARENILANRFSPTATKLIEP